jgi:hypothetical protein
MMKRIAAALLLLLLLVAGRAALGVRAQSGQFIIQNADEVNTLGLTASSSLSALIDQTAPRLVFQHARDNRHLELAILPGALSNLIAQTAPRIIFQHAYANRYLTLTAVPSALRSRIDNTNPRVVFQHAHANQHVTLTPAPTALRSLIGAIAPRIVFQHAQANRLLALGYPVTLIGDTTPPQVSRIAVAVLGDDSALIAWTTNEFADSTVQCGTSSGAYTMTFSDPLYVKQHAVTLTGLTVGTTYYCRCSSTDLSGNTRQSQEFSFEQTDRTFIYLPLVLRR